MPFAMLDLGMHVLKILGVLGGAAVGGLVSSWLFRLAVRLAFRRKVPRPAVLLVQALGALALGLAVWLWVYGTAGWGPGGGGLFGLGTGPGTAGDTKGKGETPKDVPPSEEAAKGKAAAKPAPPKTEAATWRIQMLGGPRVQEQRFYVLEGQIAPQTLAELRQRITERQKQSPPLQGIEIVIYENSVAPNHRAVRDLEKWARENDLTVTVTLAKGDLP
jgi:hypothetical protein